MPTQTLSKNERLKSYKRIRILFAEGEKFRVSPLLVYYRVESKVEGVEGVEEVEGVEGLFKLFSNPETSVPAFPIMAITSFTLADSPAATPI